MFVVGSVFAFLMAFSTQGPAFAQGTMPHITPTPEPHGLSARALAIGTVFGFPITNSMAVSWIVALGLIIFARVATRRMDQLPGGAQNLLEWLVESLYGFLKGLLGKHLVDRTFWPGLFKFPTLRQHLRRRDMLETISTLVPGLGWLLPVPFYFLELLVGVVQALVFMLLTAVFTLLMCQHEAVAGSSAHHA
jgi:F0F1-type ATP synthase membrane subunit a